MVYYNKYDEEYWQYMRTSDYKNKLSHHYLLVYNNYIPYIKSFDRNGELLVKQLTEKLDTD